MTVIIQELHFDQIFFYTYNLHLLIFFFKNKVYLKNLIILPLNYQPCKNGMINYSYKIFLYKYSVLALK